jgi:subtilisin-like proprotein convertase family protein
VRLSDRTGNIDDQGEGQMMRSRSTRLALLACASVASLGLIAGASPAVAKKAKPKTVNAAFNQCQNLALGLADNTATTTPPNPVQQVSFTVPKTPKSSKPAGGKITGVSVGVRITHTFDSDVAIYLVSPTGRFIPVDTGHGTSGDDFGTGATNCTGTQTVFADSATTPIAAGTSPFAGSFKPDSPFAALNGGAASGVWTVVLSDTTSGDSGTIHAVSLNVNYQYKKVKK